MPLKSERKEHFAHYFPIAVIQPWNVGNITEINKTSDCLLQQLRHHFYELMDFKLANEEVSILRSGQRVLAVGSFQKIVESFGGDGREIHHELPVVRDFILICGLQTFL